MSYFGGVQFFMSAPDGMRPEWTRAANTSARHVPGGNREVLQFMGRSHWRLTLNVQFRSYSDFLAMDALAGDGSAYALQDALGLDAASVRLLSLSSARANVAGTYYAATAEFERY